MNLRILTDDQLHNSTLLAAERVRAETITLLKHLSEIERRHLFSKFSCDSLHSYCVKHLKMSEPQAGRRVSASRLLNELPVIEDKIRTGAMTLTSVCQANTFFRKEALAGNKIVREEKLEVLAQLESLSTRQVEQILLSQSQQPEIHLKESVRQKTETLTEIKLLVNEETLNNLNRLKEIHSHKIPNATFAQIVEELAQQGVEKLDPDLKAKRALDRKTNAKTNVNIKIGRTPARESDSFAVDAQAGSQPNLKTNNHPQGDQMPAPTPGPELTRSRYIPAAVRHAVWMRDRGRCTFVDSNTGECCDSRRFVECDHIAAFAKGGIHSFDNLRLRCRAHNVRHAVDTFGHRQLSYGSSRKKAR